jgi:rare lipoprotein A
MNKHSVIARSKATKQSACFGLLRSAHNDIRKYFLPLALLVVLSACGTPTPPYEGVKIGKPYMVGGQVYVPRYRADYDEVGRASWYGPGFHGGRTANGERYNQNDMTAAHKTLPLPSIVRVTNLDNGRSVVVRVNDRGPFVADRIIDLSRAAASKLGILRSGTAKVRVQFLDQETRQYVMSLPNGSESLRKFDMAGQAGDHGVNSSSPDIFSVADAQGAADAEQTFAPPVPVKTAELTPPIHKREHMLPPARYTRQQEAQPQLVASSYNVADGDSYYVQAGTFSMKSNADRMFERLATTGYAKIIETGTGNKKHYRVLSGPYNSHADATRALRSMHLSGAKIIRD